MKSNKAILSSIIGVATLIGILAAVCLGGCSKNADALPLGSQYKVAEIVYLCGIYSYAPSVDTAPQYFVSDTGELCDNQGDALQSAWHQLGALAPFVLTAENFDDRLTTSPLWTEGYSAEQLRSDTKTAYKTTVSGVLDDDTEVLYYLLLQKNGDAYLAFGDETADGGDGTLLRWIFKLTHEAVEKQTVSQEPIVYRYENPTVFDKASLVLNPATRQATFSFSALSSYFAVGTYEETEGAIVLHTEDGENSYTFRREGSALVFAAEVSSALPSFTYAFGADAQVCVPDGAVFLDSSATQDAISDSAAEETDKELVSAGA